ncbi:MAG: SH3 domain-containing protein [Terracidiphilus sp.]|jgi:hypothetical protein
MPQSIAVGLLVLGGVLLLVAITGGKFKIFGAEVDSAVSSAPVRLVAGLLGVGFIVISLAQQKVSGSASDPKPSTNQSGSSSSPGTGSDVSPASGSGPSAVPIPAAQGQPAKSDPDSPTGAPATSDSGPKSVTSANEFAIVFDPPSNVRAAPSTASDTLCSVTAKTSIRILGSEGNWYQTDICDGRLGYIHRSQVKF